MPIVGCYSMLLYCDLPANHNHNYQWNYQFHGGFAEFTGETAGECRRRARKAGWMINLQLDTCTCPTCTRKLKGAHNA